MTTATLDATTETARNTRVLQHDQVAQGLCLMRAVVHSPTYRLAVKNGEVLAETESGGRESVGDEKTTRPSWKWNRHPIFKQIATNGREIQQTVDRFSVPDVTTDRLVSVTRASELILAIDAMADQRRVLVQRIIDELWYSEILPGLREFFGHHFFQIRRHLPAADATMHDRYRVDTIIRPLTLVTPDNLDLSTLTQDDARRVVDSQRDLIDRMYRERFQNLFDTIFGDIHRLCMDITEGPVDPATGQRTGQSVLSGHRKTEGMKEILDMLDRVNDFHQFTDPDVLQMVNDVRFQISQASIQDINKNKGDNDVTKAIKAAMRPLGQAVKDLWDNSKAQARRSIKF